MAQNSELYAIVNQKCPRCRKGNIWKYNSWLPQKFEKMNAECSHCGLHFEVEPGFFIGAMYVSYAFSLGIIATVFLTLRYLLNDPPVWVYMSGVIVVSLLLVPFSFRYARTIFLHLFGGVDYSSSMAEAKSHGK